MTGLVNSSEALALDLRTETGWKLEAGTLMEAAALGLVSSLLSMRGRGLELRHDSAVVTFAGAGNNGGDALAMLRHLTFAGFTNCRALVAGKGGKPLVLRQSASLAAGGVASYRWDSGDGMAALKDADLVIDGIAGTGLSGPIAGEAADMVLSLLAAQKRVASVDLPSGFRDGAEQSDPRVRADITLAIEPRKRCLYAPALRPFAGNIVGVDGVFPASASDGLSAKLLGAEDIQSLRRLPTAASHKGERGRLAIFAGSPGMSGALHLASRAAQAAGAGLVVLYVSDELFGALTAAGPGSIGGAIVKRETDAASDLGNCDAVLAGPGWGQDPSKLGLLNLLLESDKPLVLDADALRLLPRAQAAKRNAPLILTPHPGEFASLTGAATSSILYDPHEIMATTAAERGATVILKSACTWIMTKAGSLRVVDGMEPGLGVAGSGDVLAGLVAGNLLREPQDRHATSGEPGLDAACLATLVHLESGRLCRAQKGWFEAADLIAPAASILGAPLSA